MRILVTGATGFIGNAVLTSCVSDSSCEVRAAVRHNAPGRLPAAVESILVGNLDRNTDWTRATSGVEVIVHAGARVHVMRDSARDSLVEFHRVNVDGTLTLARHAVEAGVRRFIFISSIKVNGEGTLPDRPYTADDLPAPIDAYGISKYNAEQALRQLAHDSELEVVIIRPALVYGPGVKANFHSMMRWLHKGIPLPLGAIHNKRSLVALDNLVDLIITCVQHPAAANQIFLAGDGQDVSTTELLRRVGNALGKPARLIPVPTSILEAGAALAGKRAFAQRLCGSLQVDISKAHNLLGWRPPVSMDEALQRTVGHFLEHC